MPLRGLAVAGAAAAVVVVAEEGAAVVGVVTMVVRLGGPLLTQPLRARL